MIRKLDYGTGYQRPNQNWQCGNICHECHFGPGANGQCQAVAECQPSPNENGVGFTCTRSNQLGGPCHCGPTADGNCGLSATNCKPRRSLRWWRGRLTIAVSAMTVGLFFLLYSFPDRNELLAPGPLTGVHAQILKGNDRCAACHGAGNRNLMSWVADTFSAGEAIHHSQSDLCMECHNKTINAEHALTPHNLSLEKLASMTETSRQQRGGKTLLASFVSTSGESTIACSTCHREHHGVDNDLKKLTDQQCQTCHQQQFHHFAADHPPFMNWPEQKQRTINFDHNSHAFKHFVEKNKSFDCNDCHHSDTWGDVQLLTSFQDSCAECHEQSIRQSGKQAWTLFSLPMIDLEATRRAGVGLEQWPQNASGDFDGELPAIMRLLLAADDTARESLDRLGPDFQFGDVDVDDQAQIRDAALVAKAMQTLLVDLANDGRSTIESRLSLLLGMPMDEYRLNELTSGISQRDLVDVKTRWFPRSELGAIERTNESPVHSSESASRNPESLDSFAQTVARPNFGSLQDGNQGDEVLAENPLKGLLKRGIDNSQAASKQQATKTNQLPRVLTPQQAEQQKNTSRVQNQFVEGSPQNFSPPQASDEELLVKNPLKALANGQPIQSTNTPTISNHGNVSPLADTGPKSNPPHSTDRSKQSTSDQDQVARLEQALANVISSQRGNWIRSDETFSIAYRQTGHADRFTKAWTEVAILARQAGVNNAQDLVEQLSSPTFAGQCASCHSLPSVATENSDDSQMAKTFSWHPVYRNPAISRITKFSHGPHLTQPALRDCRSCHELDESSTSGGLTAHSDFKTLLKSSCASCHQANGAESNCTTCHSYHVHQE